MKVLLSAANELDRLREFRLVVKGGMTEMKESSPAGPTAPTESKEPAEKIPPSRVAQYLRISTEDQQSSTKFQSDMISRHADARNMEIVKTYSDRNIASLDGLIDK